MSSGAESTVAMPRYFFNLRDGGLVPDVAGKELPGDAAARAIAWEMARLMPKDERRPATTLIVTDEHGRTVCEVEILG